MKKSNYVHLCSHNVSFHQFHEITPKKNNPIVSDLAIVAAVEFDLHALYSEWGMPCAANHVLGYRNAPKPQHEASDITFTYLFFKLWNLRNRRATSGKAWSENASRRLVGSEISVSRSDTRQGKRKTEKTSTKEPMSADFEEELQALDRARKQELPEIVEISTKYLYSDRFLQDKRDCPGFSSIVVVLSRSNHSLIAFCEDVQMYRMMTPVWKMFLM
ncbi:hypothetical protein TNCV_4352621 [Trichonephila clavipes]|nr:hypothetical protein TNCV_4352621 [Trichonephila clavipes]